MRSHLAALALISGVALPFQRMVSCAPCFTAIVFPCLDKTVGNESSGALVLKNVAAS